MSSTLIREGRKVVAWGTGNAFRNFVRNRPELEVDYAVDDNSAGQTIEGIEVRSPETLRDLSERPLVVVFTLSSDVLKTIAQKLSALGYEWGKDAVDHALIIRDSFQRRLAGLGISLSDELFPFARSLFWNLPFKNHSSVLGTWLLLSLIERTRDLPGDAVELGVYEGGNAFVLALFMALSGDRRLYHLVDSFEGFPEFSAHDPKGLEHMFRDSSFDEVKRRFSPLPNTRICKGFVPAVLSSFKESSYSFVYYDCDLYEAARASLEHFFPRLPEGGVFLADDYVMTKDFFGVRRAIEEFAAREHVDVIEIPETTHALLIKG